MVIGYQLFIRMLALFEDPVQLLVLQGRIPPLRNEIKFDSLTPP